MTFCLPQHEQDALVLMRITIAANTNRAAPTADQLAEAMDTGDGGPSLGVTVKSLARLSAAGVISVERFQRARDIHIRTGVSTAPATSRARHWRDR